MDETILHVMAAPSGAGEIAHYQGLRLHREPGDPGWAFEIAPARLPIKPKWARRSLRQEHDAVVELLDASSMIQRVEVESVGLG